MDGQLVSDEGEQRAIRKIQRLHKAGKLLRNISASLTLDGYPLS